MAKNEKAWGIGFKRLIGDETLGETWGIVVDDTNKQLHILGANDVDTDWALSADSYPAVYIHGSASAAEYIKIYTDSTDAHFNVLGANLDIDVPAGKEFAIQVNNTDILLITGTTVAAQGYLQLMATASWVANATVTATLGTTVFLVAPGSGSLICSSWLTLKDKDGAIRYVPSFIQAS